MAAEGGHEPNRSYVDQTGNIHLNGASLFDASENDQKNVLSGVAAGYKIARGTATLDGSNPTTVATGLTTIVAAVVGLKTTSAPGDDPSWLSHNYSGSDGNLDIYAWKNTGGTDPTLVASTNNTATVDWIAIGT